MKHNMSIPAQASLKDPVCGMSVDPQQASQQTHGGTTYYFCSPHCRDRFTADPTKYVASAREFTCPMHPEVVQSGPGKCPKCGMALEPQSSAA